VSIGRVNAAQRIPAGEAVTAHDEREAARWLRDRCAPDTIERHGAALASWRAFLAARGLAHDPYLTGVSGDRAKATLWLLHAAHLERLHPGWTSVRLASELSLLKSNWTSSLSDMGFFSLLGGSVNARLRRPAATCVYAARVALASRRARRIMPATPQFFIHFASVIWGDAKARAGESESAHLDRLGACLGAMLAYNFGSRVSNMVRGSERRADKSLHAGDLAFAVGEDAGGQRLVRGTAVTAAPPHEVVRLEFDLVTTKTGSAVEALRVGRGTADESTLLSAVVEWMRLSGVSDADPLLTRRKPRKRHVTRKDIVDVVKSTAVALELPGDRYSTKSFRVGVASTNALPGEHKDRIAGWARGGNTRSRHYSFVSAAGRLSADDTADDGTLQWLRERADKDGRATGDEAEDDDSGSNSSEED
jgi:hypothetical protein